MSRYRPGVAEDFDRLYEETYPRLFATLVALLRDRHAAEDCAQEAYLRAFRAWPRWRADAPAEAWVHRIAINVAVSYRRRQLLRPMTGLLSERHEALDKSRDLDLLRELRALPTKQAAAIVLRYLHGYSNREIAYALNIPERTVASRLGSARARLQRRLRED